MLTWILGYFWSPPQGSQSSSRMGACTCAFLPSCSSSVALPFAWIKGFVALPRDASAEMGLISPGGENLLDFLELWQVLSTYAGDLRDPLWWPQERPVPMRGARGPLGIPVPSMPGRKTLCGAGAGN